MVKDALSVSLHPPLSLSRRPVVRRSNYVIMQVAARTRRLARVLRAPPISLFSDHHLQAPLAGAPHSSIQNRRHSTLWSSGIGKDSCGSSAVNEAHRVLLYSATSIPRALYSTEASVVEGTPTEAVKELYEKMLKSVSEKRSAPPNSWMWSLLEKCANHDDIRLTFDILQRLRVFRLSNLRIHENFNENLCREISKTCARVGAIDFGKKALRKNNLYGLTPSVSSAHPLLLYAKQHNDAKFMAKIMKLLKRNDIPLQPGTADIVLSICYNTDKWDLMSKYGKRFVKAGAKLRQTAFDVWMDLAAKKGDLDALWTVEKLRSKTMKQHSLMTGYACAKGFLLERKPDDAASIIEVLNQTLADAKKPGLAIELEKLVSEWPLELIKHQKKEDRKALAAALQSDIPAMVSRLANSGLKVSVSMEDLTKEEEGIIC